MRCSYFHNRSSAFLGFTPMYYSLLLISFFSFISINAEPKKKCPFKKSPLKKSSQKKSNPAQTTKKKKPRIIPTTISPTNYKLLMTAKKPVLLDIRADWGNPHKDMVSVFQTVATNLKRQISVAKISIDSFDDTDPTITFLKKKYNIKINCIPTFVLFKDNKKIAQFEGSQTSKQLQEQIKIALQK
jgi:thioredoxin-like negative regulator of GroEL